MPIELHEELERPQIVRLVVVLAFVSDERVLQHIGAQSAFLWLFPPRGNLARRTTLVTQIGGDGAHGAIFQYNWITWSEKEPLE
jgi:hypothetical protein